MYSNKAVQIALTQLAFFYREAYTWLEYGSTEDNPRRACYYQKRFLKEKTKGLVEHDRILADARYQ